MIHQPHSPTPALPVTDLLSKLCRGRSPCFIYYDDRSTVTPWGDRLKVFAWHLVFNGVVNVVAPESLLDKWRSDDSLLIPGRPLFFHEHMPNDVTRLQPTFCIIEHGDTAQWKEAWQMTRASDTTRQTDIRMAFPTIFVVPSYLTDPTRLDRLAKILLPGDSLEEWEEEFSE